MEQIRKESNSNKKQNENPEKRPPESENQKRLRAAKEILDSIGDSIKKKQILKAVAKNHNLEVESILYNVLKKHNIENISEICKEFIEQYDKKILQQITR